MLGHAGRIRLGLLRYLLPTPPVPARSLGAVAAAGCASVVKKTAPTYWSLKRRYFDAVSTIRQITRAPRRGQPSGSLQSSLSKYSQIEWLRYRVRLF